MQTDLKKPKDMRGKTMDKDIETMTTQDLERATDELLAADAAKSAPKKKSTRRTKAA